MKLDDKTYDILKWLAIICLPAFKIAIPQLFATWGIPYGEQISQSLDIIAVLLGTLIGVSCATYNYQNAVLLNSEGIVDVEDVNHQAGGEDSVGEEG